MDNMISVNNNGHNPTYNNLSNNKDGIHPFLLSSPQEKILDIITTITRRYTDIYHQHTSKVRSDFFYETRASGNDKDKF